MTDSTVFAWRTLALLVGILAVLPVVLQRIAQPSAPATVVANERFRSMRACLPQLSQRTHLIWTVATKRADLDNGSGSTAEAQIYATFLCAQARR
eukprot:SAG31_NODE_62_length_28678_cov_21.548270_4_plen_95_part_00